MSLRSIAAASVLALASCAEAPREAPAPPPIAATQATPTPSPAASPSSGFPETERAAARERVTDSPLPIKPIATPVPRSTPDPSVPPPAPLPDPGSIPPPASPDPLRAMQDSQARRHDYDRRLARLAAELDAARSLAERRERDLLAFKNPFLPRPQLAPDEAQAIQGLDGAARVKWAEDRLVEAKAALETAQKTYDDAKAHPPLN